MPRISFVFLLLVACRQPQPPPPPAPAPIVWHDAAPGDAAVEPDAEVTYSSLNVTNRRSTAVDLYVQFDDDSMIQAATWADFCEVQGPRTCHCRIAADDSILMPEVYSTLLSATFSFDQPVGRGAGNVFVRVNDQQQVDTFKITLASGRTSGPTVFYTSTTGEVQKLGPEACVTQMQGHEARPCQGYGAQIGIGGIVELVAP